MGNADKAALIVVSAPADDNGAATVALPLWAAQSNGGCIGTANSLTSSAPRPERAATKIAGRTAKPFATALAMLKVVWGDADTQGPRPGETRAGLHDLFQRDGAEDHRPPPGGSAAASAPDRALAVHLCRQRR